MKEPQNVTISRPNTPHRGLGLGLRPSHCRPLALIGTARADDAEARLSCSNATLKGTYAHAETGWSISAQGRRTPVATAGFDTFDGDGTGTGVITINSNGGVVADNETSTATYSINTDCTGTVVFNDADGSIVHFNIYLSPSGNQIRFIATEPGSVIASTDTRVAR
jgi:hypothetical protein